jgi:pimeloyl-ACP methyl ester carboxylesterase
MHIAWLAGWASSFSVWEEQIKTDYPHDQHTFISYQDLFQNREQFPAFLAATQCDTLVAWSLGTQVYLEYALHLKHLKKIILVAPVFDFCHSQWGWNRKVLLRMIRQLEKDTPLVLNNFSIAMGATDPASRKNWLDYAMTLTLPALSWGLEYLKSSLIPSAISIAAGQVHLISGQQDVIVPPELAKLLADHMPFAKYIPVADGTHWPLNPPMAQAIKHILEQ